ncbi:MAG: hypothetical protein ACKN9V_01345 [Pseudomonadota bacterium]
MQMAIFILGLVGFGNIIVAYLADHPFRAALFNSDALYLPTVFSDLFSMGGKLSQWYLTPAPYFFPDYLLFLPAYFLGPTPFWQILAFSLLQTLATFLILSYLINQISGSVSYNSSLLITTTFILLALAFPGPFSFLFVSAHHFGIFLASLLLLSLWLAGLRTQKRISRSELFFVSILIFVSSVSDNLFLIQFTLPFLVTIFVQQKTVKDSSQKSYLLFFYSLTSSIMGSVLYKKIVTHPTRYDVVFDFKEPLSNMMRVFTVFWAEIEKNPLLGFFLMGYFVIVFFCLRQILVKPKFFLVPSHLIWLVFFALSENIFTLMTFACTAMGPETRYLIPSFFYPVIIVLIYANSLFKSRFAFVTLAISGLLCIWMGCESLALIRQNGIRNFYYPTDIYCIDKALMKHGARAGVAQYWDAKYIQTFSRTNLLLAQHMGDLSEMRWITTSRYFQPKYDFAIVSKNATQGYVLSETKLIKLNGLPKEEVSCGERTLYVYEPGRLRVK